MTFLRQISLAPGVKATTVKFYPEGYTLQPPDRKRSLSVKSERYGINLFARNREVLEVYGVGPRGRVSGDDFVLIIHREKETC